MNTPVRRDRRFNSWPRRPVLLLATLGGLMLLVTLLQMRVIRAAFTLAGLSPLTAGAVLLGSLVGSAVNIPVARIATGRTQIGYLEVRAFGLVYPVAVRVPGHTTVAVNLGGAVIPTAVSTYTAAHTGLWLASLIAVAAVAVVVHLVAQPEPDAGIVLLPLVPALTAAVAAIAIHPTSGTAALAYIAGTLGTLVGADLTHLADVRRMNAPWCRSAGPAPSTGSLSPASSPRSWRPSGRWAAQGTADQPARPVRCRRPGKQASGPVPASRTGFPPEATSPGCATLPSPRQRHSTRGRFSRRWTGSWTPPRCYPARTSTA